MISVLSAGTFFQMGLANTIAVVGLVLAGIVGAGRMGTVFPSTRARIACFVVYAALPLAPGLLEQRALVGARRLRRRALVRPPRCARLRASPPPTHVLPSTTSSTA